VVEKIVFFYLSFIIIVEYFQIYFKWYFAVQIAKLQNSRFSENQETVKFALFILM